MAAIAPPTRHSNPKVRHAWLVCREVVVLGMALLTVAVRAHVRKFACAGRSTRDRPARARAVKQGSHSFFRLHFQAIHIRSERSRGIETELDMFPVCPIEPPDLLHRHTSRQMPAPAVFPSLGAAGLSSNGASVSLNSIHHRACI